MQLPGRGSRPDADRAAGPIGLLRRLDGVSFLTAYLVLLLALPSRLTLAPLGGAGSPAVVAGLAGLATWAYFHVRRSMPWHQGRQPVRTAYFVLAFCFAVSYVVAMTRAIDPEESSTAQLGAMIVLSWGGILVMANDGIPNRARLETLLHRIVVGGGLLAVLGIVQFVTGRTWVDLIHVPGLSTSQTLAGISWRAGFNRPPGTALHPIEYGAVLTMVLPLAINLAIVDRHRGLLVRWGPPAIIALATFISISRSAVICAVLGLVLLAPQWTRAMRWAAAALTALFLVFVYVAIPGLLESITTLFTGVADDSSAASRVDSYDLAGEFIARSPWFGRGFSTFLPKYRILDNQYLGLLIEVGLVGLVAMLALLLTAMWCSRQVAIRGPEERVRATGSALFASIGAAGVGLAFYDGLGFPMAGGFLFLMLGVAGAQWRLTRSGPTPPRAAPGRPHATSGRGRISGRPAPGPAPPAHDVPARRKEGW